MYADLESRSRPKSAVCGSLGVVQSRASREVNARVGGVEQQ
eukprot:CAMPEP_0206269186 /NCGR_PEP_ID=MMETSP0047_2-20121206/32143_1 /ASSEMBLY_ACC=CAM_ASM_000192 /TAXON_ID=195065 /ORGANISM="Chroomonas mesostigmatica_cf, Strain CCMP1168" /LENGTH=40 /DNA_ID= /DNA_START= /DNA_END= /DNA_ORIENTATION=